MAILEVKRSLPTKRIHSKMVAVSRWSMVIAISMRCLVWSIEGFAAEVAECDMARGLQGRCTCAVGQLHPTQITVGMQQVRDKEKELTSKTATKFSGYLKSHPAPAVWGPGGALYIIDHHHLSRALWDSGTARMYCEIKANFSGDTPADFWQKMEAKGWVYPYNETGVKRGINTIPQTVAELRDDPYRSLASYVRDACGYEKTSAPFAEFRWAGYFRKLITFKPAQNIEPQIIEQAIAYARSDTAASLPGYCGNHCSCR